MKRERHFFTRNIDNIKAQNDAYIRAGIIRAGLTLVQQGAAYGYAIFRAIEGSMGIGTFMMCVSAVSSFAAALRKMMDSVVEIRAYDFYYDALDEYLNMPQKLRRGTKMPKNGIPREIVFKNVGFQYAGSDTWALRHINLTLKRGEKLSIVGENGSGKTTLVKLLCRLYDPTEGEILLDGVNIKEIDYDAYMALFSAVFQDYQLFEVSVRENIALNHPGEEAVIWDVLEKVGLRKRIEGLSHGLNHAVGREFDEKGFLPSGGEGQKLALARALYQDAPVVILDEPAAALDPRAEYELYQGFHQLIQGKTAVYISHRLSACRFCDRIIVLDKGSIIEVGDHEALMQNQRFQKGIFLLRQGKRHPIQRGFLSLFVDGKHLGFPSGNHQQQVHDGVLSIIKEKIL